MTARSQALVGTLLLLVTIAVGQACSDSASVGQNAQCRPGPGTTGSPQTIEEAIALIDSLPKPTSISCFLESLDRPLKVNLTNSSASAQPAVGNSNPRILILIQDLTISVAIAGAGRELVEFGFRTSNSTSIKGEIEFPIRTSLSPQAPYDRILISGGTSCRFCHAGEGAASIPGIANAFVSQALRPNPITAVPLSSLETEYDLCASAMGTVRCERLHAIFGHGDVQSADFPTAMPFL